MLLHNLNEKSNGEIIHEQRPFKKPTSRAFNPSLTESLALSLTQVCSLPAELRVRPLSLSRTPRGQLSPEEDSLGRQDGDGGLHHCGNISPGVSVKI